MGHLGMAYGMASMGMACASWGRLSMGAGAREAWGVRVGGRSPMAMAGGGASVVPIQRNLLNVYPNLEL